MRPSFQDVLDWRRDLHALCLEIEKFPASEHQTATVTMASAIGAKMQSLLYTEHGARRDWDQDDRDRLLADSFAKMSPAERMAHISAAPRLLVDPQVGIVGTGRVQ